MLDVFIFIFICVENRVTIQLYLRIIKIRNIIKIYDILIINVTFTVDKYDLFK